MATTSPDNIRTPDAGDDYTLTVDLAAMADTVQDALNSVRNEIPEIPEMPLPEGVFIQYGSVTVTGTGGASASTAVTFPIPFSGTPSVILGSANTPASALSGYAVNISETGFSARLTAASGTFTSTYTPGWIAIGPR